MGGRRRRQRPPEGEFTAEIHDMAHDGRGVAKVEGKATFIHGALPGEEVRFRYLSRRRSHDEGQVVGVVRASPDRVGRRGLCAVFPARGTNRVYRKMRADRAPHEREER